MTGASRITKRGSRFRAASLAAAIASLAGLGLALALYVPTAAMGSTALAALSFAQATQRRLITFIALCAIGAVGFWAAFYTPHGYFWLNRVRLDSLAAEIARVPTITSLGMGQDRRLSPRAGEAERYDSYRFINGNLVTHYLRQVAPGASQPVLSIDDVLRSLGVTAAQYHALRASLDRLGLVGYQLGSDGQITLYEPVPGGAPWYCAFVYRPSGGSPVDDHAWEIRPLAPHWFYVSGG